jgi:hypothetical protein
MLKMALRGVIPIVVVGAAVVGTASPIAIAGGVKKAPASSVIQDPVVRDCVRHGEITREFSLQNLRAALQHRHMPADVATYTDCPAAVQSAIAGLSGPAGKNMTAAVIADCVRHKGGALTHRYDLAVLRRARRSLPADVATYTACPHTIASQIATLA